MEATSNIPTKSTPSLNPQTLKRPPKVHTHSDVTHKTITKAFTTAIHKSCVHSSCPLKSSLDIRPQTIKFLTCPGPLDQNPTEASLSKTFTDSNLKSLIRHRFSKDHKKSIPFNDTFSKFALTNLQTKCDQTSLTPPDLHSHMTKTKASYLKYRPNFSSLNPAVKINTEQNWNSILWPQNSNTSNIPNEKATLTTKLLRKKLTLNKSSAKGKIGTIDPADIVSNLVSKIINNTFQKNLKKPAQYLMTILRNP